MSVVRILIICWLTFCGCNAIQGNSTNSTGNISARAAGYGLIRFEGQARPVTEQNGFVNFSEDSRDQPLKFEDMTPSYPALQSGTNSGPVGASHNSISFQEDSIAHKLQNPGQKRRRRRRRKYRRSQNPSYPGMAGMPVQNQQMAGMRLPPAAVSAAAAVRMMLTSIVDNDDKGCVFSMLCEIAATGIEQTAVKEAMLIMAKFYSAPTGTSYNLLPLDKLNMFASALTNGLRKDTTCARLYPNCPEDHSARATYFQNHKGGLLRLFRGKNNIEYSLKEIYLKLKEAQMYLGDPLAEEAKYLQINPSASKYGVYKPYQNQAQQAYPPGQYGLHNSYPNTGNGLQQPNYQTSPPYFNNLNGNKYSVQNPNGGYVNPGNSNYSPAYTNYRRFNYNKDKINGISKNANSENEIQRRIQNKPEFYPAVIDVDKTQSFKWPIPKIKTSETFNFNGNDNKIRNGRQLKFPDKELREDTEIRKNEEIRQSKGFAFPGAQSNRQYVQIFDNDDDDNSDRHEYDSIVAYNGSESPNMSSDDEIETVYVVRGGGDPSRPEIFKLRPGEVIP